MRTASGSIMRAPHDCTAKTCIVLAVEGRPPKLTYRHIIQPCLHSAGLHLDGLDEILTEIDSDPRDDGRNYPVLILIDGRAQVAWVDCPTLGRGGDA